MWDIDQMRLHYICSWEKSCEFYFSFRCAAGRCVSPPLPPSPTPCTWGRESVSTCTCSSRWPLASGCNICRSVWWPWLHLRCQTWRPRAPVWSLKEAEKRQSQQKIIQSEIATVHFDVWHFFLLYSLFFPETKDHRAPLYLFISVLPSWSETHPSSHHHQGDY